MLPNAVDLARIPPRPAPLSSAPLRAACFTNSKSHLPIIKHACEKAGITLDLLGRCGGKTSPNIEQDLVKYDIVFATGKSALEAACSGCAVIVCDHRGLGGMLTTSNVDSCRDLNFALRLLTRPITVETIGTSIEEYDASDAAKVSEHLRATANMEIYLDRLLATYESIRLAHAVDIHGAPYRDALLAFLRSSLARTNSDRRWPWLEEKQHFTDEIARLDGELAVARERMLKAGSIASAQ